MSKKTATLWILSLLAVLMLSHYGTALAGTGWTVNVSHDLNGGLWPAGQSIAPYQLSAPLGQSMATDSLSKEQMIQPQKPGAVFEGWGVLFTDLYGNIVYDGRDTNWDLNHPFDYYAKDPREMNCLMVARWKEGQQASETWTVNVTHQLKNGVWPQGKEIEPYQLSAPVGQSMAASSLSKEQMVLPEKPDGVFKGWGVLFTDTDGNIIYDGRNNVWDLNHPFDYYPDNPRHMECLMVAIWEGPTYEDTLWSVNVSHLLRGGQWPIGKRIEPYRIIAPIGQSMPYNLSQEQMMQPVKPDGVFKGWSVLFYDAKSADIVYDGRDTMWDLNFPFDYYPENPREMDCLMIANWEGGPGPEQPVGDSWKVNVSHDLNGGAWQPGKGINPYWISAPVGQSMDGSSLIQEQLFIPQKPSSVFKGWGVLFTDASNGNVIYDGRNTAWDLNHPFDFYPDNPREMNCVMVAIWEGGAPAIETWKVNVTHDLNGGTWPAGQQIDPYWISAPVGQSMVPGSLGKEQTILPLKPSAIFKGWGVLFTDASNGNVIYDGRSNIWDLNHPFDFYPDNPREMNCVMVAIWEGGAPAIDTWKVNVTHDLNGGTWPAGQWIDPYWISALAGQSMAPGSLSKEQVIQPQKAGAVFKGWGVLFTDASNGNVIYDGRSNVWDLNHPFDFYPDNPREMNCVMIANWQ